MSDKERDPWLDLPETQHHMNVASRNRGKALTKLVSFATLSSDADVRAAITNLVQYDKEVENLGGKGINDVWG